jgi:hypothetical protein
MLHTPFTTYLVLRFVSNSFCREITILGSV